MLQLQIAS